MSRPRSTGPCSKGGFSLIEIMIAMGILVIGMSGVMALFTASLALQKRAAERLDVSRALLDVQSEIERDLAARLAGEKRGSPTQISGTVFPVPGEPAYQYRVTIVNQPGDERGRAFLCRVVVFTRRGGEESPYDLGYLSVIPHAGNDAVIRSLGDAGQRSPGPSK